MPTPSCHYALSRCCTRTYTVASSTSAHHRWRSGPPDRVPKAFAHPAVIAAGADLRREALAENLWRGKELELGRRVAFLESLLQHAATDWSKRRAPPTDGQRGPPTGPSQHRLRMDSASE